jgi:hypothetical protein
MTNKEFSDQFDTLLNSYSTVPQFGSEASGQEITLNEYEKSIALTRAEKNFVIGFYTGRNDFGFSFEEKEIIREALDALVRTATPTELPNEYVPLNVSPIQKDKHIFTFFPIPDNLLYTVFEEVKFSSYISDCEKDLYGLVVPTTHDELWHRLNNPFRGPSKNRVLRLNAGNNLVELVSDYPIGSYLLRYVEEPKPIILIDLPDGLSIDGISEETECMLPDITHHTILEMAVNLALQSKMIGFNTKSKGKD